MPRRGGRPSAGPRLWLDKKRQQWVIRDGPRFIRTGCGLGSRDDAEKFLQAYLGKKHAPTPSNDPLIDEVLATYATEHAIHTTRARNVGWYIGSLLRYWSGKRVSEITARTCRGYADQKIHGGARTDLECLRAAVRYWHREYGPLSSIPIITLPHRPPSRDRWLTRAEAARLLHAARRNEPLKRFILLGLYTGSRSGAILALQWDWIDFERGVMRRKADGEGEKSNKRRPPVRLGKRILAHLRRWKDLDGASASHVVKFSKDSLHRAWAGMRQRTGLSDVSPHTLRHTRATWLMQAGVPIWEAAGHLGMTVKVLEEVYGHHHPDWQRRAADV